jgi:flagella basal body P-ring formation protein FlgA
MLAAALSCLLIDGSAVRAADLASRAPEFARLDPETRFDPAPSFGAQRWLTGGVLRRWGARFGLTLRDAPDLCLARRGKIWTAAEIQQALPLDAAWTVEILETPRGPLAEGALEFDRRHLPLREASANRGVIWRGRIRAMDQTSIPVWVRLRIRMARPAWILAQAVEPGGALPEASPKEIKDYPLNPAPIEPLPGATARRRLAAGHVLRPGDITLPLVVQRGDRVAAGTGSAVLATVAESPGALGARILIQNPLNGKRLPARVTGPGSVQLERK